MHKDISLAERLLWHGKKSAAALSAQARRVAAHFRGTHSVSELTTADVLDFVNDMYDRGNTAATINRKLSALSAMLKAHNIHNNTNITPFTIPWQREQPVERAAMTQSDVESLLAHDMDANHRAVFHLLWVTGVRWSEIKHIQLDNGVAVVSVSKSKGRRIPLRISDNVARTAIEAVRTGSVTWHTASRIFKEWDTGQHTMYSLRHGFGTTLADNNVPLPTIQYLMGHKTINITMRYLHQTEATTRAALECII